jgi:uncharacterized protein (TIGR02996 family)
VTDGDALLRAILVNPADDAPRLAYADWLDEQGRDVQAKYVRMAIDLVRNTRAGYGHEVGVVLRGLERKFGDEWFGFPIRTVAQVEAARRKGPAGGCCNDYCDNMACDCIDRVARYEFGRGLPSGLICRLDDFMIHAHDLFSRFPLTDVSFPGWLPYRSLAGQFGWSADDERFNQPDWIPDPLWKFLEPVGQRRSYPTAANALEALRAACIAYGRSLAGLEPL